MAIAEGSGSKEAALLFTGVRAGRSPRDRVTVGDLELKPGAALVLSSESPRANRSLFRLALGFTAPERGVVRVHGECPTGSTAPDVRARIGYVPARPDVPRWMRAHHYYSFVALHYRDWNEDIGDEVGEALGIDANTQVRSMTWLQVWRVQLVAALAGQPGLLLLDQPVPRLAKADLDREMYTPPVQAVLEEYCSGGGALVCVAGDASILTTLAVRRATWSGQELRLVEVERGELA